MKPIYFALSFLSVALVSACSETSINTEPADIEPIDNGSVQPRLRTLENSEAFYDALKDALINQGGAGNFTDTDVTFVEADNLQVSSPESAPSPSAPQDSADSAGAGASSNEVTSTNVQEIGVDEQDRVKLNAAGTQLFILNNTFSYGGPIIIDGPLVAVPEPEPDIAVDPIEPASSSSFIPEQATTTLRILALDSETPDAQSLNEVDVDLAGRNADGFYLYEKDGASSAVITATGGGYWGFWDQPAAFSGLQSIIAKVDVTDAANAAVSDTFTMDGQMISSRRIGDSLFFASRYYPAIPDVQPWELSPQEWRETIETADLAGLMPQYTRNNSEQSVALVDPSACFVAPGSDEQPYYSPDIITLGIIDLSTMQLRNTSCFLGATETLYATTESVFLATTQYSYQEGPTTDAGEVVDVNVDVFDTDIAWFDPRTSTDIHQFDIEEGGLSYAGSGSVRGHLGWNLLQKPFRMSESGGYLRVATMNDRQGPEHSPILLNILQADGQGNLVNVSSLPNSARPEHIGKPGEQLYASRFLGDKAYLVTFRQTDPLYVIDLENPADPQIRGELEIEGYSDYLAPVGEGLLLGIGKNAVAAGDNRGDGRGAWVQGIKLALFDVSNPDAPTEIQSVLVGERGTDSVALYNHRAITIQAATELHPARVSFGIDVYGEPSPLASPSPNQSSIWKRWNYTGMHGFDVSVGVNAAITPRGALIVERADNSNQGYATYGDDRSVMVNDALFYIHGKDVYSALWDNLGAASPAR